MSNKDIATAILQGVKDDLGGTITNENDGPSVDIPLELKVSRVNFGNNLYDHPYMWIKYYDRKDWNSDPNRLSFFVKLNIPGAFFPVAGEWTEKYVRHSAKGIESVMRTLFKLDDTGFEVYIQDDVIQLWGEAKGLWDYAYDPDNASFIDKTIQDIATNIDEITGDLQYEFGEGYEKKEKYELGELRKYSYSVLTNP